MKFDFWEVDEKQEQDIEPEEGSSTIEADTEKGLGGELAEPPRPEPVLETCQYCGKEFKSVGRHLPYCDQNPDNQHPSEPENGKGIKELKEQLAELMNELRESRELIEVGKKHVLNYHNLLEYFKRIGKLKLYELKRYFHEYSAAEIKDVLDALHDQNVVLRNKNGWYYLNPRRNLK